MNRKTHKSKNKIPKAFIISLAFAFLFWSLIKLSKEYKTIISFTVDYINIPQDKLIQKTPLDKIEIQIKGTGFRLLTLNFKRKTIHLDARNLRKKKQSEYYFLIKNQTRAIQNQITGNYVVDHILKDTIYLNLGTLISKKVPVINNLDFEYKLGFNLVNNIKLTPDSIVVFGPESQINSLKSMQLEDIILKDISKDIYKIATIKRPELLDKINYRTKKVTITGKVDRFTEGTIKLPFHIINLPDSISVNTFTKTIDAVYQVALSDFNKVDKNSFEITCDYKHSSINNLNYLIPRVSSKPDFVTSVKLIPNKIEFLIQK